MNLLRFFSFVLVLSTVACSGGGGTLSSSSSQSSGQAVIRTSPFSKIIPLSDAEEKRLMASMPIRPANTLTHLKVEYPDDSSIDRATLVNTHLLDMKVNGRDVPDDVQTTTWAQHVAAHAIRPIKDLSISDNRLVDVVTTKFSSPFSRRRATFTDGTRYVVFDAQTGKPLEVLVVGHPRGSGRVW